MSSASYAKPTRGATPPFQTVSGYRTPALAEPQLFPEKPGCRAGSPRRGWRERKERQIVAGLPGRREFVPAKAVIDRQLGRDLPGIADVQRIGVLLGAVLGDIVDVQVTVVDRADKKLAKGLPLSTPGSPVETAVKLSVPDWLLFWRKTCCRWRNSPPNFIVCAPCTQVTSSLRDVRGPGGLVELAKPLRIPPTRVIRDSVATETGGGRSIIGRRVRDLGRSAGFCPVTEPYPSLRFT